MVAGVVLAASLFSGTASSQEIRRSLRIGEEWEYDVQHFTSTSGFRANYRSRVRLDAMDSTSKPALYHFVLQDTGSIGLSFLPETSPFRVSDSATCRLQDGVFACDTTRICMPGYPDRCINRELSYMFDRSVYRPTTDSDLASGIGKVVSDSGFTGYIWRREYRIYGLLKETCHVDSRHGLILADFFYPSIQVTTSRIVTLKSHDGIPVDAGSLVAAMDNAATGVHAPRNPGARYLRGRSTGADRTPLVRFFDVRDHRYFDAAGRPLR